MSKNRTPIIVNSIWDEYKYTPEDIVHLESLINKYNNTQNSDNINNTDNTKESINTKRPSPNNKRKGGKRRRLCDDNDEFDNIGTNNNDFNNNNIRKQDVTNKQKTNQDKMLGWISATKTKNYMLDDQSVDWLAMYYSKYGIESTALENTEKNTNRDLISEASSFDLLMDGGNVFEKKVYEEFEKLYDDDFVIVFTDDDMKRYREQKEKSIDGMIRDANNKVKRLMRKGIPIIAQAPLINDNNMTFGVADLLVRSDYLGKIYNTFFPDDEINIKAPFLNVDKKTGLGYHYRVIDCKWTTMVLCVDGVTIRNEGRFPAYKGQLAVYTACLESLQGYIPSYAYIMPKAWRIDKANITENEKHKYRGYSAFDRLGVINYAGRDNDFVIKTKYAIQWVQRVMTEGRTWRYFEDKPTVPELYPNMNKSFNPAFDKVKSALAKRYGDPTLVWYVTAKHRKNALSKGICSINDERCTIDALGISRDNRGKVIEEILNINRPSQNDKIINPDIIRNNMYNWQKEHALDYYVDFETINYNIYADPTCMDVDNSFIDSDVTFMIGIGYQQNENIDTESILKSHSFDNTKFQYTLRKGSNGWEYLCLYLVNFTVSNELEIFRMFFNIVLTRSEIIKAYYDLDVFEKSRLFHWTGAEIRFTNRGIERITSITNTNTIIDIAIKDIVNLFRNNVSWIDMYKVFESEPIVIKGSYRFKLKHIGNAFHKYGFINTNWDDGNMSDGFRAMIEAIKLYRSHDYIDINNEKYNEIINYNEVDCKVIWEIVSYLRSNHCLCDS